jgi:micrococcal nuclease
VAAAKKELYIRNARVIRIVDGDTLHLDVDLGFDSRISTSCRLDGIDTPEMKTPAGKVAKARLEALLPVGTELVMQTVKDNREKYGRYLTTIFFPGTLGSINQQLIDEKLAVAYSGGKK